MALHYLETGSTDPAFNLAFEEFVLENRREGDWLMLWQNANSVIVGLNQNAAEEVDPAYVRAHGIRVVRRMTGGGAVYHDLGNLNYSFITDALDTASLSMEALARPVCRALSALDAARDALAAGLTPDAVLTEAEDALAALAELTGRSVRDDVTDRIFSRFCVGK